MLLTGGYQTKEIIYTSEQTIVYRGWNKNGDPVILKVLNDSHPNQEKLERFRLEHEILQSCHAKYGSDHAARVIQVHELVQHHNSLMIVLEDMGGDSLEQHLQGEALSVGQFLSLALHIIAIVEQIHGNLLLHKDINPSNILWNPEKDWVRVIDFGISEILTREYMESWNYRNLEGTPAYLAPEQTGRMNRAMDFRTDLYSLGATFYFLLTGSPPFSCSDTLEMVHCHLARQAQPPHDKNPHLPIVLSQIVLKLLAKEPEQRYQTINGLKRDVQSCQEHWQEHHSIPAFALGRFDVPEHFIYPQKLFGRDTELQILTTAFERTCQGESQVVFVTGQAGVGKSFLIHEAISKAVFLSGYFVSGKFDQSGNNAPHGPVVHAFRELVSQLLTESNEHLSTWKEKLLLISKIKREVICRFIPELQVVFGAQNQTMELPPQQLRDQFQLAFLELVKIICQKKVPLVLFVDDLQWSDQQSLQLLERMIIDPDVKYLLLIFSYRDTGLQNIPHVRWFDKYIETARSTDNFINLEPLSWTDVSHLVAKCLQRKPREVSTLVDLCMTKTNGNPFFLKQFLNSLYNENLLYLKNGIWSWDLNGIRRQNITENVADLIISKIKKQSIKNQELLQISSCIGMTFDVETLAAVMGLPAQESGMICRELLKDGFIIPYEARQELTAYMLKPKMSYQFVHDRVYQATYSMIESKQRTRIHLEIGRFLQQKCHSDMNHAQLSNITRHLNISISLMSHLEQCQLAELNFKMGRQAMLSTAHNAAFDYFRMGIKIFGEEGWLTHYKLVLQLHNYAVEVAYVAGYYQQMLELVESVKKNAHQLMDSIKVQENKIIADTSSMQFSEALNDGLNLLRILGLSLPEAEPSAQKIEEEWAILDKAMSGRSLEWFLDRPDITDLRIESALKIIATVVPVATILGSRWMPFLLVCGMQQIIKYGHSISSSVITCDYAGMCLCGIRDDIESGYMFGQTAILLMGRYNNNKYKTRILFEYNVSIRHWKEHYISTILPSYKDGISAGLDVGDIESVSYNIYIYVAQSFFFGRALSLADKEVQEYRNQLIALKNVYLVGFVDLTHQAILNLLGQARIPHLLVGEKYNETEELQKLLETGGRVINCNVSIIQLILRFLFQKWEGCEKLIARVVENLDVLAGNAQVPIFLFFDSLFHLAIFSEGDFVQQQQSIERVRSNQMRMRKWALYGPMNLDQMVQLVDAEQYRVLGEDVLAQAAYNKSIELARKYGFIHIEAMAFELAGCFYLQQGVEHLARYHLSEARYAYSRWGAFAKVADLNSRFPGFFLNSKRDFYFQEDAGSDLISVTQRDAYAKPSSVPLDLPSIIKASHAISREIDFNKLVYKLLHIVMENAGAQRGCLISTENNELSLLASVDENRDSVRDVATFYSGEQALFSKEIVLFVLRTKEFLVLEDASSDYKFAHTDYVTKNKIKSILCLPLFHQDKVNRIIYLENNLLTKVFTLCQVETIRILGTQASISLTNAKVIKELKTTEKDLLSFQQQLRNLSRHQQMMLENEQKKISQLIHDELGSVLTRIRMETELFLDGSNKESVPVSRLDIVDLLTHIDQAMVTIRRVAFSLRPKTLDQCGLLPALQWQAKQFSSQFSVQIVPQSKNIRLDEEREITLFRIGQEAITNIARHAGASQVFIYFDWNEQDILLSVSDNGRGINLDEISINGMGIQGMKERAMQLSGSVQISNADTGGTVVAVTIPRKSGDVFKP
ncbi:protein kinase domain-containing protein [Candidatus Magnetaquicoccus inordinatus]|uniref:protein kinase domain-containing protein n=1 Tax=Candidatus Magnetaquicoccus inordinatus TaxID=2496818 RepID=UPI00187D42A2|nr:AAA family ATPase [Candidatus Magnetaquicoccus inordinatus]